MVRIVSLCLLGLSVAAFAACLTMQAFVSSDPDQAFSHGGTLLALGWLGILLGHIGWLANPLYVVAIIFTLDRNGRVAAALATCAIVTALTFAVTNSIKVSGGGTLHILHLAPGYWLWIASMVLCLLAAVAQTLATEGSRNKS